MKEISKNQIVEAVAKLCTDATYHLGEDVKVALQGALKREKSPLGKNILAEIVENFELADKENVPMCQDTGISVFFVELGTDVHLDCTLEESINEGVRKGYQEGYLRKSVCDPFSRVNTGDNTPAVIHIKVVEGDKLTIEIATKGAGSENMSAMKMLKPSQGVEGIKELVMHTVTEGGGNPCPPIVVGIGVGGDFEMAPILAKRSLFRKVGSDNPDPELDKLEKELKEAINKTGIGPMGFGGTETALAVYIEARPCHIASLPVAVNIQCHADRHKGVTL